MVRIRCIDDLPPETIAMLQALYSRSPASVDVHLGKVLESGPDKFMSQFYVGYNHKSIGDCGTTTLFIEGISMLAAKAIQDTPLYNGQEASTRYMDMAAAGWVDPLQTDESYGVMTRCIQTYVSALDVLNHFLPGVYPWITAESDVSPAQHEKALKARAFDIARGLLPAGCRTNVAWHVNLRQANDHLKNLRHHPLEEVRTLAFATLKVLQAKYSASFLHKQYEEEELYIRECMNTLAYHDDLSCPRFHCQSRLVTPNAAQVWALENRPPKAELPKQLRILGELIFHFCLDFGSFRDMQRQRSAIQEMPLLTSRYGMHPWYLDRIGEVSLGLRGTVEEFLRKQVEEIELLKWKDEDSLVPVVKGYSLRSGYLSAVDAQYFYPIGFQVGCKMACSLPSAVYITGLRSGTTVHPTLREVAWNMADALETWVPCARLDVDRTPDQFCSKRGAQDIVEKVAL